MLDNPICVKDADHLAVWVYLLLNATHTEIDKIFRNKRVTLTPGQLLTGRKSISSKLDIHESKVQRILTVLENEQQIEQQTSSQNRLVTILNWSKYQQDEQQSEQQVNNGRTTSEQQVNTNKNERKEEGEKERNNIDDQRFEEFWTLYPKKTGKPKCKQKYKSLESKHEEIMKGLRVYVTHINGLVTRKKTDPTIFIPAWKNPLTYLNGGYWEDQYEETFKATTERIDREDNFKKNQEVEQKRKQAEKQYELFKVGYLNKKFGENNWSIFKVMADRALLEELNNQYSKLFPKDAEILFKNG